MTALLDTGSQVTCVSHDFCLANGIQGPGGGSIEYLGYAEASLSLPMGPKLLI